MRKLFLLSFVLMVFVLKVSAQIDSSAIQEIILFQKTMNAEFADSSQSPLTKEDLLSFKELNFFPINLKYRVECEFEPTPNEKVFGMKTTTARLPNYVKFGVLSFKIDSITYHLNVYQNQDLIKKPGFEDYLFVPFTDATNGSESYGGGRYIDFKIPKSVKVILDFNQAYNPYCAYNKKYSCPVPPSENDIPIEIKAGVMKFDH